MDGKKMDAKALAERLKKDTPVVVAAADKAVDRFYLQEMKETAIILILPTTFESSPDDGLKPEPKPIPKDEKKPEPKPIPKDEKKPEPKPDPKDEKKPER